MAIMENRRRESALSKRSIGDEVADGVCYLGGTCQGLCRGDLDHPRDPDAFFERLWATSLYALARAKRISPAASG